MKNPLAALLLMVYTGTIALAQTPPQLVAKLTKTGSEVPLSICVMAILEESDEDFIASTSRMLDYDKAEYAAFLKAQRDYSRFVEEEFERLSEAGGGPEPQEDGKARKDWREKTKELRSTALDREIDYELNIWQSFLDALDSTSRDLTSEYVRNDWCNNVTLHTTDEEWNMSELASYEKFEERLVQ